RGKTSRRVWNTWCRRKWGRGSRNGCIQVRQPLGTHSKVTRKVLPSKTSRGRASPYLEGKAVSCQRREEVRERQKWATRSHVRYAPRKIRQSRRRVRWRPRQRWRQT